MLKPAVIDLSHHNIVQSLVPAVDSGIVGCIHKLTESDNYIDPKVKARRHLAGQAGMEWGLYHFVRPGSMQEQVDFFVSSAQGLQVSDKDTLWVLDWEDAGVSLAQAIEFLEALEKATGRLPCLYSGNVLKEALKGRVNLEITRFPLWIAHYTDRPAPSVPMGWNNYWLWQYTESGACPGIQGSVDLNAYQDTKEQLIKEWRAPIPQVSDKNILITIEVKGINPDDVVIKLLSR